MIELPKLPYSFDALEPHIDAKTVEIHYSKHHQGYVNKLNAAIKGTEFENMHLEDIVLNSDLGTFNNAAQIWNHSFYRNCLTANGTKAPEGELLQTIENKRGSFEKFKEEFNNQAITNFGSGWTWLIKDKKGELEILNTSNAETPITQGLTPLLTIDIREHAYYLKYQNRRPEYIEGFWNLVNRNFVEENLK